MRSDPTILVVDDNAATLKATVRILEQAGYPVAQATDGATAFHQVRTLNPGLVLLDVNLPDVSGPEVLRQIRTDPALARVTVVLLSAYQTMPEQQADGLDAGADGYIARPIARAELLARVRSHLRQRELTEQLRTSEARYRALFEYAPDGILIAEAGGKYLDANASFCRMVGYTRDELIGLSASDIVPPEEIEHIEPALSAIKTTSDYRREWQLRRKDGSVFPTEVMAILMPDGHLLAMIRDLTGRKRAEEQIAEQASFLNKAQDAIFVRDLEGRIRFWNEGAERLYGWASQEVMGRTMDALLYTHPIELKEAYRLTLRAGEWHGELAHLTKGQQELTIESRWTLIRDHEGHPKSVLAINTDITGRKKLEQQFLRAQRMESIGTLAGGIAHDLNNVLGPIILSLELLAAKFTDPDSVELLEVVTSSARRGSAMVRQVLSFARGVDGERQELQLRHLVREVEQIINETCLRNLQVLTHIPTDLWTVIGDATQLHQVLMNLCVNARDAMPEGGTLTISAENVTFDTNYAGTSVEPEAQPGPYVVLHVEDTGMGMSKGVSDQIFDPFFTTKEMGKGTGLGLSTTLGIVRSHGGFIRVQSESGKGTTFTVYLPAQPEVPAEVAAEAVDELPRGHDELILVVDDEEAMRLITQTTLETFGYRVMLAANGVEAVALYAAHRTTIAAVFTDMKMPVMDGPATIRVLLQMNPAVRVIAASGLATNENAGEATSLGAKHFLPKPYTAATLLTVLRETLHPEA